jgi:hypothetical protein
VTDQFISACAIGLLAVAVVVGGILFMQRGAHMDLTGPVAVRILPTDANTALAVVDLKITNPSDYDFEVSNITITLETAAGEFPVTTVGRVDAKRLFDSMPEAGPFHPTLYTKAVIPAHATADYTLLAQYNRPETFLKGRKRFTVQIQEINGKVAQFAEK